MGLTTRRNFFLSMRNSVPAAAAATFAAVSNTDNKASDPKSFEEICIENGHQPSSNLQSEELRERNRLEGEFLAARSKGDLRNIISFGLGAYALPQAIGDIFKNAGQAEIAKKQDPHMPHIAQYSRRAFFNAGLAVATGSGITIDQLISNFKRAEIKNAKQQLLEKKGIVDKYTMNPSEIDRNIMQAKFTPTEIVEIEKIATETANKKFTTLSGFLGAGTTVALLAFSPTDKEIKGMIDFVSKIRTGLLESNSAHIDFDDIKSIIKKLQSNDKPTPILSSILPPDWLGKELRVLLRRPKDDLTISAVYLPTGNSFSKEPGFYKLNCPATAEFNNENIEKPLSIEDFNGKFSISILGG